MPPEPLLPLPALVAMETNEDEFRPETEEEEQDEEDEEEEEDNEEDGLPFFTGDWRGSERAR